MKEKVLEFITYVLGFIVALPALTLLYVGMGFKFISEVLIGLGDGYVNGLERFVEYCQRFID